MGSLGSVVEEVKESLSFKNLDMKKKLGANTASHITIFD